MRFLLQAIDSKSLPIRPTVATENLIRIINCMLNNYAKIFNSNLTEVIKHLKSDDLYLREH